MHVLCFETKIIYLQLLLKTKDFCIPITFNIPTKVRFPNKKCIVSLQTRTSQNKNNAYLIATPNQIGF